jgi:hypothetical protein
VTQPASWQRRQALRFLIHQIEDLHQPLHVGDNHDRGGDSLQVRFFRRGTSLHHLRDTLLLEHWSRDEDWWLAELVAMDNEYDRTDAMDGTLEGWATDTLQAARLAYQDPATGRRIKPGARLGQAYYEANLPLAEQHLFKASARLAWVPTDTLRPV